MLGINKKPLKANKAALVTISVLALFICAPLVVLFTTWGALDVTIWQHLQATNFLNTSFNTCRLVFLVTCGATGLGSLLGWWSAANTLPRWLDILLVLPLALPKYVLGFIYLWLFDYAGVIATFLRQFSGGYLSFYFETGTVAPVAFVMIMALYPYVFLLVREGLSNIDGDLANAARVGGASEVRLAAQIIFPVVKPWVISGALLVSLETIADFGTVAVFNYDTFTTLIYKSWFGLFSFATAGQLSSLVVIIAIIIFSLQSKANSNREKYQIQNDYKLLSMVRPKKNLVAYLVAALTVTAAFFLPILAMVTLAFTASDFPAAMTDAAMNTILIASCAALLITLAGGGTGYLARHLQGVRSSLPMILMRLGYGLPGVVLAVGVLLAVSHLDNLTSYFLGESTMLFTGTLFATQLGLVSRFFVLGLDTFINRFSQISKGLEEMAQIMGANSTDIAKDIYIPLTRRTAFVAFLLVFVEVAKEMPITLMTRQFGFDTLAIKVFEYTSEGSYEYAVVPSLLLVVISLLPVALLGSRRAVG